MTDLTFIEDGNPDKVGSLINFKKRYSTKPDPSEWILKIRQVKIDIFLPFRGLVFNVLAEIQSYQQTSFKFAVKDDVQIALLDLPVEVSSLGSCCTACDYSY